MIGAILLLWRAQLRGSRRRVIALALLTALGGGIALAGAAGARRTAGAYEAVLNLTNSGEFGTTYGGTDPDKLRRLIETIPAVGDFSQRVGYGAQLAETPIAGLGSFAYYPYDPVAVERPILLEGRMPRAANEVLVNQPVAAASGVSVGEQFEIVINSPDYQSFFPETMTLVGIGLHPDEVYQDATETLPVLIYSKEFADAHPGLAAWGAAIVTVAPGADRADVVGQLLEHGITVDDNRATDRERARAVVRPLVVTLAVLALLAGLATIVVVGQALNRLVRRRPGDTRSLAATGCSRAMLRAADVGVAGTVGALGSLGAVGVAVAASPLFPLGGAGGIPGVQGLDVDTTVLAVGSVALLVALMGVVAATAERRTRQAEVRPGWAPGALGRQPTVSTGVRFATGRRGLISTTGGAVVGLGFIVAAVTFTGSMERLVSRPELAGFSWDLVGRDSYALIDTDAVADRLRDRAEVQRITGLSFIDTSIDGTPVPASVWTAVKGSPWPPLIAGRTPQGPNEVLMSTRTLDGLGYSIGDTVTVGFATGLEAQAGVADVNMTVVGTAVSPAVGLAGTDTPRLDEGLLVRREDFGGRAYEYGSAVLFDLSDNVGPELVKAQFPEGLPDDVGVGTEWFETAQPAEVIQAGGAIDVLVLAIGVLLIGVVATIAHNLLGFVRERRSAFAVLKALGFTPRQIRATVLWQSGLVVGIAMVAALPLGIAAGRWLYQGFAGGIGVIVEPAVPVLALSAALIGAFVVVQAVALVPAGRARRTNAARELRWE